MNWDAEPATEKQLNYLKMFGYEPDRQLTKTEAHDLLSKFEEDPERCRIRDETRKKESAIAAKECMENLAHCLHRDCIFAAKEYERAERDGKRDAHEELKGCLKTRIDFWKETIDLRGRLDEAFQTFGLCEKYGQRFKMPSSKQIQSILDALMPIRQHGIKTHRNYFIKRWN